ncbi:hypothetical protein [Mycobacterium sp.]|jgi:hypothetical protein|uniref:hypothetical protein n=1 Tax=Mycobacterium sp. TaxID=1785 RepID=UPI003C736389
MSDNTDDALFDDLSPTAIVCFRLSDSEITVWPDAATARLALDRVGDTEVWPPLCRAPCPGAHRS